MGSIGIHALGTVELLRVHHLFDAFVYFSAI